MRSAELVRGLPAIALAIMLAGCGTVSGSFDAVRDAVTPSKSTATTDTAVRPAGPPPEEPVDQSTQHAFDDASRLLRSGRTDEAEKAFRALALAHPDLGGPHANLGVIYRQGGKLTESVTELETAVRLNPRQPIYFNQLGVSYRMQGQFAKARDAYQRAIALNASYASATLNLGILYDLYLGDTAHALEMYGRYLALSPGGDPTVTKWVADLKNRKPGPITDGRKEKA